MFDAGVQIQYYLQFKVRLIKMLVRGKGDFTLAEITAFVTNDLYYKHCYTPSIVVIMIVRCTSICSVPYDCNYLGASNAKASLLEG
jgi:hypothetical protein